MATHSSIPAWRIPWTEEPGGLQSTGLQEVDTPLVTPPPPPPPVESLQRPLRAELSTVAAGWGWCWGPGRSGGLEAA